MTAEHSIHVMQTRITCLNVVDSLESEDKLERRSSCVHDVPITIDDSHMHLRHRYRTEIHALVIRESLRHMITDSDPLGGVSHRDLELSEYVAWHHAISVRPDEHRKAVSDEVFQDEV